MNLEKITKKPNIHFNPSSYRESNVLNFDELDETSGEDNDIFPESDEE